MTILSVQHVSKTYGKKHTFQALKDINFDIQKGEFVAIMGPSGSGKTTLLNVLSSIDQISSGSVIANGQELNKLNQEGRSKQAFYEDIVHLQSVLGGVSNDI